MMSDEGIALCVASPLFILLFYEIYIYIVSDISVTHWRAVLLNNHNCP